MTIPYTMKRKPGATGRPGELALLHPQTGEEYGRIVPADDGYIVRLPDPNTGRCSVLLPNAFPTVYAARQAILEHHEQRSE